MSEVPLHPGSVPEGSVQERDLIQYVDQHSAEVQEI